MPWLVSREEVRDLVAYGKDLQQKLDPGRPWEVVIPIPTVDLLPGRARQASSDERRLDSPDAVATEVEQLRGLGATRFSVSFAHDSVSELLDQLEAFATRAIPLL